MKWLWLSICLWLSSCRTSPVSRYDYEAHSGLIRVRAERMEDARALLALAEELYPQIAAQPQMLAMRPIELRVGRQAGRFSAGANRWQGELAERRSSWIELKLGDDPSQYRWILAHELTHYLLGDAWLPLPMIVEEGLCDAIAGELDPYTGASRRLSHAVLLSSWLGPGVVVTISRAPTRAAESITLRVNLDREELPSVISMLRFDEKSYHTVREPKHHQLLYAFGYVLVDRIGPEKLLELCARAGQAGVASVPPEWLLAAAGIDASQPDSWKRAIDGLIGPAELEALEGSVQGSGSVRLQSDP